MLETPYEVRCPKCGKVWAHSSRPMPEGDECFDCFAQTMEKYRRQQWEQDMREKYKQYEPELGQAAFGNRWSELQMPADIETYATEELSALLARLGGYVYEATGPDFELRSYVWEDCICEGDEVNPKCRACKPNFRFGDLEIRWYKHVGRGMSVNRPTTVEELQRIFDRVRVMVAHGMVRVLEEDEDADTSR